MAYVIIIYRRAKHDIQILELYLNDNLIFIHLHNLYRCLSLSVLIPYNISG